MPDRPRTADFFRLAYSPFLKRHALTGAAAVEQMADDFRIIAANAGAVTADDLETLGWTAAQIESHKAAARSLAFHHAAG